MQSYDSIAKTSIQNGVLLCDYLLKGHHGVQVLPSDYPIFCKTFIF